MNQTITEQKGLFGEALDPQTVEQDPSVANDACDDNADRPILAERCTGLLFCSRCGAPTTRAADAEFCPFCGMRRCVSCGDL